MSGREVAREEVPDDAERKLRLLVDELGSASGLRARLDRLPQPLEEDEVALDVLCRGPLGRGADDHAARGRHDVLENVLEPLALGVLEAARDTESLAVRDVDEEPAGQRDLRREPRALGLHRVLHRLHEDLLAPLDEVGDLLPVPLALELGHDDLVDVQEAVLLETDLDERGLHPGQDVVDRAEVDVPGDRPAFRPLEVDLGDAVVLEQRDALLADVDRDQELALRLRERRSALRLPPALATARALAVARPLAVTRRLLRAAVGRRLGLGGRCLALRRLGRLRLAVGVGCRTRLTPSASSSASSAPPGPGGPAVRPGCLLVRLRRLLDLSRLGLQRDDFLCDREVLFLSSDPEPGQESFLLV